MITIFPDSWKESMLSMGAKVTFLKAAIQSIPVFAIAVFKIPKQISKLLTDAMAAFWWGDTDERKKMHCVRGGGCVFQKKDGWDGFS
jgi:hypothetical protein